MILELPFQVLARWPHFGIIFLPDLEFHSLNLQLHFHRIIGVLLQMCNMILNVSTPFPTFFYTSYSPDFTRFGFSAPKATWACDI